LEAATQLYHRKIDCFNFEIYPARLPDRPPIARSHPISSLSPVPHAQMIRLPNHSKLGNILLVDDKPDNLRLLSEMLSDNGYEVRRVTKGKMALITARASPPDLVLLDIKMPDMDGYEVCLQLKADSRTAEIPVIFMSALDELPDKVKAFTMGGVDYITKPFQLEEVLVRVKTQITLRRQQQQLQIQNRQLQEEIQRRKEIEAALQRSQTELQKANTELYRLAHLDGLTHVANRRRFDEYIDREWRRLAREKRPLSLIMCDVDYFKPYNDHYGHQMGDDCLRAIARAISDALKRPADLAARYGGEEFAILLPNTPLEGAIAVAEDISRSVRHLEIPHPHSQIGAIVTLSFGVGSQIPRSENHPSTLIDLADRALYRSKQNGRDRVTALLK